ncbi:hypothetical protein NJ76_06730 [Rhodococcus sp. IITR03]|nr:hypothetical protein NJ76_06730 [Rhodococcus sp. IITR03]
MLLLGGRQFGLDRFDARVDLVADPEQFGDTLRLLRPAVGLLLVCTRKVGATAESCSYTEFSSSIPVARMRSGS